MNYFTYVLQSEVTSRSYVGSTNNLERRLWEHNHGKSTYTSKFIPWKIVFVEKFATLEEARSREKYLKGRSGRRFLKEVVFHSNNPLYLANPNTLR